MTGTKFKQLLEIYNLTVNRFLDLRDEWNRLSATEKCSILKTENADETSNSNNK